MINTPFNYTGSKFKLLEQLLPNFDYSKKIFIDVFAGGGSVYTNIIEKYEKIIVNDIIEDLINIHKELLFNNNFIEEVKLLYISKDDKEGFLKLRDSYNKTNTPQKLYALMLSCTNNMMRFNKKLKFNQTFGERSFNKNTELKIKNWKNHLNNYKEKILFKSLHFSKIPINENAYYYLDPPYSNTEAGYNAFWNKEDDDKLYKYCLEINNKTTFSLSHILNDKENKLIDNLNKYGFKIIEFEYDYNKVSRNGKKEIKEILIKNY